MLPMGIDNQTPIPSERTPGFPMSKGHIRSHKQLKPMNLQQEQEIEMYRKSTGESVNKLKPSQILQEAKKDLKGIKGGKMTEQQSRNRRDVNSLATLSTYL